MEKKMAKKRQNCEKKQKITEPYFPWREMLVFYRGCGNEGRSGGTAKPVYQTPNTMFEIQNEKHTQMKNIKTLYRDFYERFWLISSPLVLIYIYPNVAVGKTLARKVEWLCLHSLLALTPTATTTTTTTFSTKILLCHDNNLHLPEIMVFVCFELCQ